MNATQPPSTAVCDELYMDTNMLCTSGKTYWNSGDDISWTPDPMEVCNDSTELPYPRESRRGGCKRTNFIVELDKKEIYSPKLDRAYKS